MQQQINLLGKPITTGKDYGKRRYEQYSKLINNLRNESRPEILPFRKNAGKISKISEEKIFDPYNNKFRKDRIAGTLKGKGVSSTSLGTAIVSPTITTENAHGYGNTVTCGQTNAILKSEIRPQMLGKIQQICKKRKFKTPKEINEFLRKNRKGMTIREISEKLKLPKTQVEHYFRTDVARAIPSPKIWLKLKVILEFSDEFDKQVTTIYEKEIEFEQTRRVYASEGCSPTLNATKEPLVYERKGFSKRSDAKFRENEGSPTLTQKMGTGGNNVPMILSPINFKHKAGDGIKTREHKLSKISPSLQAKPGGTQQSYVARCLDANMHKGVTPEGFFEKSRRNIVSQQASCLTKNYHKGQSFKRIIKGSERTHIFDNKLRRLTPRECERLQSFPDLWTSLGINEKGEEVKISDTQRYRQLGNAVTVSVIEAIIKSWFSEPKRKRKFNK